MIFPKIVFWISALLLLGLVFAGLSLAQLMPVGDGSYGMIEGKKITAADGAILNQGAEDRNARIQSVHGFKNYLCASLKDNEGRSLVLVVDLTSHKLIVEMRRNFDRSLMYKKSSMEEEKVYGHLKPSKDLGFTHAVVEAEPQKTDALLVNMAETLGALFVTSTKDAKYNLEQNNLGEWVFCADKGTTVYKSGESGMIIFKALGPAGRLDGYTSQIQKGFKVTKTWYITREGLQSKTSKKRIDVQK
jgi:hypothetical protein